MTVESASRKLEVVCPSCHSDIAPSADGAAVCCTGCGAHYPVIAAIPVFLSPEEWTREKAALERDAWLWQGYLRARRTAELTRQYYDWWTDRMMAELPNGFKGPVLELMSGAVEIGRRLPVGIESAMAIDLNVGLLERAATDLASADASRVAIICATAARMPLRTGSVPVILIQGGLHHVRPILPLVVAEIARVLAPGGLLIASEPADDNPVVHAIRNWQYAHSDKQGFDEQGFTRTELQSVLGSVGLQLEKYSCFGHVAYPLMGNTDLVPLLARTRSRRLGRVLLWMDECCARLPLVRAFGFASIFVARRSL